MKRALTFGLRMALLLASAATNLMVGDPRGFAVKVAERIRLADGPVRLLPTAPLRAWGQGQRSAARILIGTGHLTHGVREIVEMGSAVSTGDVHLAKRTMERVVQLEAPIPSSPKIRKNSGAEEHRILHFLTNSEPFTSSGYTVRSAHVLACQQQYGIEVLGVTRLGYPVLVGKIPSSAQQTVNGVSYRRLLPPLYPASISRRHDLSVKMLVAVARDFGATILHTTTDYTNAVVVADAASQLGIPWVYEVRGELESTWLSQIPPELQEEAAASEFYRAARRMETKCMQAAGAVVALSEVSRRQMLERGVPEEKIVVIPNAVDDDHIGREYDQTAVRRELGLPVDQRLVGTVTAVVDYEGLDTLFRSLEFLPPDYSALVVGDGTARPALEAYAEELGFRDRIIFAGRRPATDIWRWYAALDVFVVPRKDTVVTRKVTPIKPLIAMALNIPVVASDLPALREVTGERALYVPAEDPQELARGITEATGSDQSGSAWAAERTWSANGRRYKELYEGL